MTRRVRALARAVAAGAPMPLRALPMPRVAGWDLCAGLGLALVVAFVLLTFRQYGITWDEDVQAAYGQLLARWYASGFTDRALFDFDNLYLYGGGFDLPATLIAGWLPFDLFATRHLLGGMVGVLGLVGAWTLGRRLGGPRAGVLAAALLFLTPSFWGHVVFNPKDPPFAVAMVWALVMIVRVVDELPRPRMSTLVLAGAAAGFAMGTRVGGVLALVYLAATLGAWLAWRAWAIGARRAGREALAWLPGLAAAGASAYAVMGVLWPWSVQAPLNPLRALHGFAHFGWDGLILAYGQQLNIAAMPRWYLPGQLVVQLPEVMLAGLGLALVGAVVALRRGIAPRRMLPVLPVALAALFPIVYFVATAPAAYHGYRHFLFVVPPLAVLAALGIDWAWRRVARARRAARLGGLVLALALLAPGISMVRLFPNEYIYFNALAGGVPGAAGRFNLDYWGSSLHEASDRLVAHVGTSRRSDGAPWRVLVGGDPRSVGQFLPPNMVATDEPGDVDFFVALTESDLDRWQEGREIDRVTRMGVPLAIVKDLRRTSLGG